MTEADGQYRPPQIVFDDDEAGAVAQPLLAEDERGQLEPLSLSNSSLH